MLIMILMLMVVLFIFSRFTDAAVIRKITCILKMKFDGAWATWKMVDPDSREAIWQHFKVST